MKLNCQWDKMSLQKKSFLFWNYGFSYEMNSCKKCNNLLEIIVHITVFICLLKRLMHLWVWVSVCLISLPARWHTHALVLLSVKPCWEDTLALQSHPQFTWIWLIHNKVSQDSVYQWSIHSLINKSCYEECAAISLPAFTRLQGVFWSQTGPHGW